MGEDGGGPVGADASCWDDRVLPALLGALFIKMCLKGTLSKRLMRRRQAGNKSERKGPSFGWDAVLLAESKQGLHCGKRF